MTWRIGSVPYLNARPLIYGIEDKVTLCVPSRLADLLHRSQFDVGLVPVAEILQHDQYDMADGIAIASRGPVASVFLVHREPVEKLKLSDHEAMMLFGDGAIWYRHRNGDDCLMDLGEAWTEMTGLPFVYAAWAVQKGMQGERRRAKGETTATGTVAPPTATGTVAPR